MGLETMRYRHANKTLRRIDEEPGFNGGFDATLVEMFGRRMQLIRDAPDEREFRNLKSLHFEKLKGDRKHQHSMRLNDRFRLILVIEKDRPGNTVIVSDIEDYH